MKLLSESDRSGRPNGVIASRVECERPRGRRMISPGRDMLASDRTAGPLALQNSRNRLMTDSAASQLGAVAAVYLLWFVSWLVLGQEMFGPAYYNWAQTLVAAAAALLAFRASRQAARPYPGFLVTIGLGLALLAASWVTYSPDAARPFLRFATQDVPNYSDVSYALFVFTCRLRLGLSCAQAVAAASALRAHRCRIRRPDHRPGRDPRELLLPGVPVVAQYDLGPARCRHVRPGVRSPGDRPGVHSPRRAGRVDLDAAGNGAAGGERHGLQRRGCARRYRAGLDAGAIPARIGAARLSPCDGGTIPMAGG